MKFGKILLPSAILNLFEIVQFQNPTRNNIFQYTHCYI